MYLYARASNEFRTCAVWPIVRPLQLPPLLNLRFVTPNMKSNRKPVSKDLPTATKSKGKTYVGTCILFEGVHYRTLAGFAKEYGINHSTRKYKWFRQQLSKHPLDDRLRILRSAGVRSLSGMVRYGLDRDGKVDAKNMHDLFVPANEMKNTGNADLFKSTVLE